MQRWAAKPFVSPNFSHLLIYNHCFMIFPRAFFGSSALATSVVSVRPFGSVCVNMDGYVTPVATSRYLHDGIGGRDDGGVRSIHCFH